MSAKHLCSDDLLSRLARHCPDCRLIQAKHGRRLPLTAEEKHHLLVELYFIQGTRHREDKRNPTWKRWPRR